MVNSDGVTALYAALVRQAVEDVRSGYHKPTQPCPRAFLMACGFMDEAGTLDPRFGAATTRTGRSSQRKRTAWGVG